MEQIFNKLVRDNIPNIIDNNGEVAVTRVLDDEEYKKELYKKLLEEANEVINSTEEETLEELADVLEILSSIASLNNKSIEDIIEIARMKREKRGGFQKRLFLERTYEKGEQ